MKRKRTLFTHSADDQRLKGGFRTHAQQGEKVIACLATLDDGSKAVQIATVSGPEAHDGPALL